jgi:hypothetical protein
MVKEKLGKRKLLKSARFKVKKNLKKGLKCPYQF